MFQVSHKEVACSMSINSGTVAYSDNFETISAFRWAAKPVREKFSTHETMSFDSTETLFK